MALPSAPMDVPFSIVLSRILEPAGYRLTHLHANFRYFDPPRVPWKTMRRICFPVEEGGLVKAEHVQTIITIIDEDAKGKTP